MSNEFRPRSLEHEQQVLARLADGSLDERDRRAVEAYVAGSPEAQVRLARQRRVAMALRTGGPVLSPRARAELDALMAQRQRAERRRPRLTLGLAGVAGAIAAAIVLLSGGAGTTAPSITKAAELAYSPSTGSAPQPDPANPRLLRVSFQGITLPNYASPFGVRASGRRSDRLGGRTILTVYYRLPDGTPISYSIVSGSPLALPANTRPVTYLGVRIRGYTDHGLAVVTLVRDGRTCVLAGRTSVHELVALAEAPLRSA